MSSESFREFQHWSYGPNWRSRLAQNYIVMGLPHALRLADRQLSGFSRYLVSRAESDPTQSFYNESDSFWADVDCLNSNPAMVTNIKMLTLAGIAPDEIAELTGVKPQILAAWNGIFFDVQDYLACDGWMNSHVIRPAINSGCFMEAAKYKSALGGGPHVVRAILRAETRIPSDESEKKKLDETLLSLRASAAMLAPITTEKACLKSIQIFRDWDLKRERLEFAKSRAEAKEVEKKNRRIAAEYSRKMREGWRLREGARRELRDWERRESANVLRKMRESFLRELKQHQRTERADAITRAASSPLAKLRWAPPSIQNRGVNAFREFEPTTTTTLIVPNGWTLCGELEKRFTDTICLSAGEVTFVGSLMAGVTVA